MNYEGYGEQLCGPCFCVAKESLRTGRSPSLQCNAVREFREKISVEDSESFREQAPDTTAEAARLQGSELSIDTEQFRSS